jgi:hypothetical protein
LDWQDRIEIDQPAQRGLIGRYAQACGGDHDEEGDDQPVQDYRAAVGP